MRRQRGFNLVELLIGVTISLMGLAAVGNMMSTFSQKRATITQTLAAQDNGVMALYRLERDLSQAGYGLMGLQGCATIANGAATLTPLPVQIVADAVSPGTVADSILVQYGGASTGSGVPAAELNSIAAGTNVYNVKGSAGFASGDYVVATTDCILRTLTAASSPQPNAAAPTSWNMAFSPAAGGNSAVAGTLANLGTVFVSRNYQIAANALTVSEMAAAANNLVDDIVFLKAQYGLASSNSSTTATTWQGADTFVADNTNSKRVIAVRVGVVARSALRENTAIEQPATITLLPAIVDSGVTTGPAVSYTVPDTRYRYRAYSTVIPLRNVIWTR